MNPQASPSLSLGRRVATVLGVLAICLIARWIPVPTIPLEAGQFVVTRVPSSIIALGVKPLIGGYVLVELAALLVPRWRSWRTGGAAERAKLARASLLLGLGLSLFQAVILNDAWQVQFGLPTEGRGVRVITLIGTVFLLVGLAKIVDREGLGSGLVVVLLATILPEVTASFGTGIPAPTLSIFPCRITREAFCKVVWASLTMVALINA